MVAYAGTGSADNRTAQVVEAWRADGSLAARFWLDDATKLPLERQVFDSAAHVIGQDVFIDVSFAESGGQRGLRVGDADGDAHSAAPQGPWTDPLSHAQLLALRARGWLVPAELPGGLSLFTGAETEAEHRHRARPRLLRRPVGDLGVRAARPPGGQAGRLAETTVDGHEIFVAEPDQRSLTWSSRGMVYTVMVDAPAGTVDAVVGVLPHDRPPGFWKRMSRGMVRLASWVNPFR